MIKWLFHHGTVELKSLFSKDMHLFACSTHQAIIMLAFNYRNSYSYKDLLETVKLPEREFESFLRLMCNPRKYKLFLK